MTEIYQRITSWLFSRRQAYLTVFSGPEGQKVLRDLARFCRANQSTYHTDPRLHAVAEGRREVFLRIQHHLKLTQDQIWELYGKDTIE